MSSDKNPHANSALTFDSDDEGCEAIHSSILAGGYALLENILFVFPLRDEWEKLKGDIEKWGGEAAFESPNSDESDDSHEGDECIRSPIKKIPRKSAPITYYVSSKGSQFFERKGSLVYSLRLIEALVCSKNSISTYSHS